MCITVLTDSLDNTTLPTLQQLLVTAKVLLDLLYTKIVCQANMFQAASKYIACMLMLECRLLLGQDCLCSCVSRSKQVCTV